MRERIRAAGLGDAAAACVHADHQLEPTTAALRSGGFRIAALAIQRALIDPTQPELYDAGYPAWCDALAAARSHAIPLVVGPLANASSALTARHDDVFRFAIDSLRKMRFDAERCGARMGLRVEPGLGWSAADLRELIDEANSFWVGIEFDVSVPARDASTDPAASALELLTHRVVAVRLGAADTTAVANWRGVVEALQLDVPLIVDLPEANAPRR